MDSSTLTNFVTENQYSIAAIHFSHDAIVTLTLDGIITTWNPAAQKIYGYSSQEILGKSVKILFPRNRSHEFTKLTIALKNGQSIDEYETVRLRKDKTQVIIAISSAPIQDGKGKVIGIVTIARDITERKRIENNIKFLSEAGKIFSASLNLNQTLQTIVDVAATYVAELCGVDLINEKGEIELGAIGCHDPRKKGLAIQFREIFPRNFHAPFGVWKAIDTQKPFIFSKKKLELFLHMMEKKGYGKLMKNLHVTASMHIPLKVHGKVIGALTFASIKKVTQFTKNDVIYAEEVTKRAAIAIENAQLYTKAKNAISLRDDFIAMASHELKTPLTSVNLFIQIAQKRFRNYPSLARLFEKLKSQINQLTTLITELLDINMIKQGKLEMRIEKINLKNLIYEIVEDMQQLISSHKLILNWRMTDDIILADKERLRQVMCNLITNATKYSPDKTDIIIHSYKKGRFLVISVQDAGIGIPKDEQKKIFERFYKAELHKTYPGFGLGLYISNNIITHLGGTLWVKSNEGKGSIFSFSLPLV